MKLIDADQLKKDFRLNFGGVSHVVAACEIIDKQPTIDSESLRPHGKWVDSSFYNDRPLCYDCSNCGHKLMYKPNYCPNCGAKMN